MTQGYTLEQLKQMGGTPAPAPAPAPAQGQGYTLAQLQQMGGTPAPKPSPTLPISVSDVGTGLENFGQQALDMTKQTASGAGTGVIKDVTALSDTMQSPQGPNAGSVASAIGHASIGTVSDLSKLILSPLAGVLGAATHNIADLSSEAPGLQKFATSKPVAGGLDIIDAGTKALNDWAKTNPDAAKHLSDIINVAGLVAGGKVAPEDLAKTGEDINAAGNAVRSSAGAVSDAATATSDALAAHMDSVKAVANNISAKADNVGDMARGAVYKELPGLNPDKEAALNQVAEDWAAPTKANKAGFKAPTAILAKNPDTTKFLADQGLSPYDHIEDGKYATADTAESLREQAGQMSRDMLRPSLTIADYSTPRTPIAEIQKAALANAKTDPTLTAGNRQSIIDKINKESLALETEYPKGMSLVDMHDNKITYAKSGGYSPVNDPAVNNIATANRSLSSAMGRFVDQKTPDTVPVKEFNAELAKYYKAADYLDSLNTKTAPVSMVTKVIRGVAKFGGAGVAAHMGGGIFSEFAGYQVGKNIERILENIAAPHRADFLNNLSRTNPDAFKALVKYQNSAEFGNDMLRLPEGSGKPNAIPMGGLNENLQKIDAEGNIIPTETTVQALKAKTGLPVQDPKTGKMKRVYTSEGTPIEKP